MKDSSKAVQQCKADKYRTDKDKKTYCNTVIPYIDDSIVDCSGRILRLG